MRLARNQYWHTRRLRPADSANMHVCARALITTLEGDSVTYSYVDVTTMGTFHGGATCSRRAFRYRFPKYGDLPASAWPKMDSTIDLSAASGITYQPESTA